MKKNKLNVKLTLKKETITNLNAIKGGSDTWVAACETETCKTYCATDCADTCASCMSVCWEGKTCFC